MTAESKQSANPQMIVQETDTILLIGGAKVSQDCVKKCLSYTNQCVAVDGGADLLRDMGLTPRAVIGDLDSISDAARHDFATLLHPTPDQNMTDFEKALMSVSARVILAPGFLGGRLDHTFSTLNVLVRHADRPVILIGDDTLAFAIRKDVTLTLTPGMRCALLPMQPARVSTDGLRWDLDDQVLAPDGLVSSSNAVALPSVQVQADRPVIMTLPLSALPVVQAAVRAG